jgi:hypothetical protein
MPTNVYFDTGTTSEQRLYEDIIIEQLKIYGQDVYYLPRKIANKDTIFGEDPASSFDDSYIIEMYVDNSDGYMGEQEIIKKFGLELRDDITFTVSKLRWETLISNNTDLQTSLRPNEGDLVYFPTTKKFFEIQFVEHEAPFYQQSALPIYKLSCTTWEYSSERLDTGITSIDATEDDLSTDTMQFQFSLELGTYQAFGTSTLSGDGVSLVSITNDGAYTTAPTVTFSQPDIQGVVTAGSLLTFGAGHTNNAFYNMVGGSGSGLQIRGTGAGGMIGFTIAVAGTGYQVGDVVSTPIGNPATLEITAVNNNTLTLGTAVIDSSGTVTEVTITEAGTGYTSAPTVTFTSSDLQGLPGAITIESTIGAIDYFVNEDFTMATQQPVDMGQAFETAAGTNTASTADDILDFSERNPFGEVDEY